MSVHSELSPSNAHRWMNCPGSVALARKAPKPVPSEYAAEGTRAHRCLEYILRRLGAQKKAEKSALKAWPKEMVEHVSKAVNTIRALRPSQTAKLLCEHSVALSHLFPGMKGTLDASWVEEWGELVTIDFKYGAGVAVGVKEENGEVNPQLMSYAAGVARMFDFNFETVTLAIIQPRIWDAGENGLSKINFPVEALAGFEEKIKAAAQRTQAPKAPLSAGEWCKFCPAASICPEISTKAIAKAGVVFDLEHGVEATPDPKALSVPALSKILPACDQIETWISEVRTQAFLRAERGERIEGYKLVHKRSTRAWLPKAEAAARKRWGKKVLSEPEFLSPAQLEKRIGKDAKSFLEKFTSSVSSGTTLVKATDPRGEVTPALVFDTTDGESKVSQNTKTIRTEKGKR